MSAALSIASATFEVTSPYDGSLVGSAPDTPAADVHEIASRLVSSAKREPGAVSSALGRARSIVAARRAELSLLISRESGLALKDTRIELDRALDCLDATLELLARPIKVKRSRFDTGTYDVITEPVDLVYAITPFNHPLLQVCHKLLPALAVGAPILLKPCERVPLSALVLTQLLVEAGVPQDYFACVTTSRPAELSAEAFDATGLDVVSFTGSYDTGRAIGSAIARSRNPMVRQIYELGGCSPLVVCADGDLERAVAVALTAFRNSGQRCTTIRKIFVEQEISEQFMQRFVAETARLRAGDPIDEATDVGTLIDEASARAIEERVQRALEQGARLLVGGRRERAQLWPTVLTDVPLSSAIMQRETFGPVVPICTFDSLDEVVKTVHGCNDYRLAAGAVTRSLDKARALARALGVGQFNLNAPPGFRLEHAPFGGFKKSGNGCKEGIVYSAKGYSRQRTFYAHV